MSYTGKRLQPGEIRILTLHSGWRGEPILCSTRGVSLEQAAQDGYSALSYAWGPPTQPHVSITVNDADVRIGQQLLRALEHLRDPDQPRALWVDALCINQIDAEEKTAQLPLMGRIYSDAATVEIWLGTAVDEDGAHDDEWAMRAISSGDRKAQDTTPFLWAMSRNLRRPWFSRLWVLQELVLAAPRAVRVRVGGAAASWIDFRSIVRRMPDFLREIEELDEQEDERVHNGADNSSYSFADSDSDKEELDEPTSAILPALAADEPSDRSSDCFEARKLEGEAPNIPACRSPEHAAELAGDSSGSQTKHVSVNNLSTSLRKARFRALGALTESISSFTSIAILRPESADAEAGGNEGHTQPPLGHIFMAARPQFATDPRDKVYGLLGMVDDATRAALRPSYEKSKLDVFRDATVHLLTASGENVHNLYYYLPNSWPLADDGDDDNDRSHDGRPSWVVDFSYTRGGFVENYFSNDDDDSEAAAREEAPPSAWFLPSDEGVMLVKTTIVDRIAYLHTFDLTRTAVAARAHSADVGEVPIRRAVRDAYALYDKARVLAAEAGWAPAKPEPLWQTLTGPPSAWNLTEGFSEAELDHKLDLLAGLGGSLSKEEEEESLWRQLRLSTPLFHAINAALVVDGSEAVKTFFITRSGVCGLCVGRPRVGDVAAVLFRDSSAEVHFILRPSHGATATTTAMGTPEEAEKFRMVGVARISDDWWAYCEAIGNLGAETVRII